MTELERRTWALEMAIANGGDGGDDLSVLRRADRFDAWLQLHADNAQAARTALLKACFWTCGEGAILVFAERAFKFLTGGSVQETWGPRA
jgi:hypothetical protein